MSGFEAAPGNLLPLAVAVPIISGSFVAALRKLPRSVTDLVAIATALAVTGFDIGVIVSTAGGRSLTWSGDWVPYHGFSVGVLFLADPLGAGMATLAAALVACALAYTWKYFEAPSGHYQALMLLFLAGMEGFAFSGDIFDMFVFFELMGAVAYALTGFKIEDRTSLQGALNFGIMNSLGAYLSLFGVALIYAHTGQLGLPELGRALAGHRPDAVVVASFILISTGFLVKAAMAPFHFWLADAHAVAPSSVCVLFSGVMVELGIYAFARVYHVVFAGTIPAGDVRRAFIVLGVLTAIVGSIMCFSQRHIKRLLAYSTVAHVGLFLMGVAVLDAPATAGAAIYIASHAGVKSALFLLAGLALNRYGSVDEHELFGAGRNDRVAGVLFVLAGLALAGLPPFGIALGKSVEEAAVAASGYSWAPAVFVITSAVTGGAAIRAGLRVWWGVGPRPGAERPGETKGEEEQEVATPLDRDPLSIMVPIVVLLAGALAIGVVPQIATDVADGAARFVSGSGYIRQALFGGSPGPLPAVRHVGWTLGGVALDLASALAGCGLALGAIYAPRMPLGARLMDRVGLRPGLQALRRLHSGHIGDYAAWLVVGIAAMAALVGLPLR